MFCSVWLDPKCLPCATADQQLLASPEACLWLAELLLSALCVCV